MMLATLFGLPLEDRRKLARWSDVATGRNNPDICPLGTLQWRAELIECREYFATLWKERAHSIQADDLISMLAISDHTKDMSPGEFLGNLILLIVGGNDTTRNAMTGGVYAFSKWPEQFEKLRADPSLLSSAVSASDYLIACQASDVCHDRWLGPGPGGRDRQLQMRGDRQSVGLRLVEREREVEASLWRRLRFERDPSCRERLFERYQSLARCIAVSEFRRRPSYGLERADFLQLAFSGLLEAVDRFDLLHGAPFSAYARRRIRGSISDGLARSSEGGAQYRHARRLEVERLRSLDEPSARSGKDAISQLSDITIALAIGLMVQSSKQSSATSASDLAELGAYESVSWRDVELSVLQELEHLPEVEQTVLKQHYLQDMSFKDIASLLGRARVAYRSCTAAHSSA